MADLRSPLVRVDSAATTLSHSRQRPAVKQMTVEERLERLERAARVSAEEKRAIGADVLAQQMILVTLASMVALRSPDPLAFTEELRANAASPHQGDYDQSMAGGARKALEELLSLIEMEVFARRGS